jgi:hypothetical protein
LRKHIAAGLLEQSRLVSKGSADNSAQKHIIVKTPVTDRRAAEF